MIVVWGDDTSLWTQSPQSTKAGHQDYTELKYRHHNMNKVEWLFFSNTGFYSRVILLLKFNKSETRAFRQNATSQSRWHVLCNMPLGFTSGYDQGYSPRNQCRIWDISRNHVLSIKELVWTNEERMVWDTSHGNSQSFTETSNTNERINFSLPLNE
jgi:hypothetical protein